MDNTLMLLGKGLFFSKEILPSIASIMLESMSSLNGIWMISIHRCIEVTGSLPKIYGHQNITAVFVIDAAVYKLNLSTTNERRTYDKF